MWWNHIGAPIRLSEASRPRLHPHFTSMVVTELPVATVSRNRKLAQALPLSRKACWATGGPQKDPPRKHVCLVLRRLATQRDLPIPNGDAARRTRRSESAASHRASEVNSPEFSATEQVYGVHIPYGSTATLSEGNWTLLAPTLIVSNHLLRRYVDP